VAENLRSTEAEPRHIPLPEPVVERLVNGIDALEVRTPEPSPAAVAEALQSLADALELLPETTPRPRPSVRELAAKLANLPAGSSASTAPALDGLDAIRQRLAPMTVTGDNADEFREAVNALSAAREELRPDQTLRAQAGPLMRGLRAAADAVLIAGGNSPRFASTEPALPAGSREELSICVEDVRSRVRAMAAAAYPREREAASSMLASLADCLSVSPHKPPDFETRVSEIRFEVSRLRAAPAWAPREAAWVKAGLISSLEALESLPVSEQHGMATWLKAARRAAGAIADDTGLVFQRGRIQDALRTTADALAAAAGHAQREPGAPR
jgi:hypothetical protein